MQTAAPAQKRTCFVIMPIRKEGTTEYAHFRALYDSVIKPTIEAGYYEVCRADEVQETGAITRDIILRLAEADLVVADLTDLNPNVFYELGVRHSLRGFGTIMLLDTLRTEAVPFDLGIYRVLRFEGRMEGIGRLRQELSAFVQSQKLDAGNTRDNPVHDILPGLPINAAESVNGAAENRLKKEVEDLRRRLGTYEVKYGVQAAHAPRMSPSEVVRTAIAEVGAGHSPVEIVRLAEAATNKRDIKSFLEVLQRVFDLKIIRLTPELYEALIIPSTRLGLDVITEAIYEHALTIYPSNKRLRTSQLMHFAHSPLPSYRERARQELLHDLGISVEDNGDVNVPSSLDGESFQKFGIMLDAYHADNLDEQALRITSALVERYGDKTRIVRNHARALNRSGKGTDAISWYQRAIWCPDAEDTSVLWLGNHLHNLERHVDSLEVYLLACNMDSDDASFFAHVADELAIIVRERERPVGPSRQIPREFDLSTGTVIRDAVIASISCPDLAEEDLQRCMRASRRIEGIDIDDLLEIRANLAATEGSLSGPWSTAARVAFAKKYYALLKSDITRHPSTSG